MLQLITKNVAQSMTQTEAEVKGTALQGWVLHLEAYISQRMELRMAYFQGLSLDTRGSQLVWQYTDFLGKVTLFRFDLPGSHINVSGAARNVFGGHVWPFSDVLLVLAQFRAEQEKQNE